MSRRFKIYYERRVLCEKRRVIRKVSFTLEIKIKSTSKLLGCYLFHFAKDDVAKIQSERRFKCIELIENTRGAQLFWVDNKEDKNSISLDG